MSTNVTESPKDWCPSCGESQATHTPEEDRRCTESFYATNTLVNDAIARALAQRSKK